MIRKTLWIFVVAAVLMVSHPAAAQRKPGNDDGNVAALLRAHVDEARLSSSVAVAVVDESGTKFFSYGRVRDDATAAKIDEHTIYELGSITKTFVGTLYADAIRRGEIKADDPISKYLPASVKSPTRAGREILLRDLVTHTSSLPGVPTNFVPDPSRPYALFSDYTISDLYAMLSGIELKYDIGSHYEYSNVGMGLLAHILSLRTRMTFPQLVETRIFKPLGMKDSYFAVPEKHLKRHAQGYNAQRIAVELRGNSPVFQGSGGIRSTSADMAKYAAAALGIRKAPLSAAFEDAQKPILVANEIPLIKVGAAWHETFFDDYRPLVWHNGRTSGFGTMLLLDKQRRRAVVVLANSARSVDDLARYVLDPAHFPKPVYAIGPAAAAEVPRK